MTATYPEIPGGCDDTVREEGTAAHWAAHRIGAGDWVPEGETAPNGVIITEEMLDGAHLFVRELQSWGVPVQQELTLPAPIIHELCGGTSDGWGYNEKARLIKLADFKFGFRYVDAFENWQLICYLAAILSYLGIDGYDDQSIDVEFIIVQPRSYGSREGPIRKWRAPVANFRGHFNRLRAAIVNGLSNDPQLKTGAHCEDCSARYTCPAFQKASLDVLEIVDRAIPHELTPAQLGPALARVQRALKLLEAMESGLNMQAMHMIRSGALVLGYEAAPTMGRLNWKEGVEAEVIALAKMFGHDIKKPDKPLTPTQTKNLLPASLAPVIDSFAERKQNGVKLSKVTDNQVRKFFERR